MPLAIQLVTTGEKQVLDNLLQLYLHETSRFRPADVNEDGRFDTAAITANIETPAVDAYLIRIKGKLAGFAVVQPRFQNNAIVARSLTDLFILESYRGFGIAEEIARMIFDQHPGLWHIEVTQENEEATKFWNKVIYRYTGDNFRHLPWRGNNAEIFEFRSPGPRPTSEETNQTQLIEVINAQPQNP